MSTERTYEVNPDKPYAEARPGGRVVSRSLFAVVERSDMPLDGGFGEAQIVEVPAPDDSTSEPPVRVRIDTVPEDTIATSPDAAFAAATVMQGLSNETNGQLGFRVDYSAD